MNVLAISGSTRAGSLNTQLLRAAAAALPPGVEVVELDPALIKAIPAFDEDDEARAGGDDIPALRVMRDLIAEADAVLFATPEYNASVPGALKNALDWISRPIATNVLRNKPVAVIGASTGLFGAAWAQAELRKILQTIGAKVVDRELALAQAQQQFDGRGSLLASDLREQLLEHVDELLDTARQSAPRHSRLVDDGVF
jgi:chromate reductase, NAD(P)H dehydrogenase (quinone)